MLPTSEPHTGQNSLDAVILNAASVDSGMPRSAKYLTAFCQSVGTVTAGSGRGSAYVSLRVGMRSMSRRRSPLSGAFFSPLRVETDHAQSWQCHNPCSTSTLRSLRRWLCGLRCGVHLGHVRRMLPDAPYGRSMPTAANWSEAVIRHAS